MNDLIAAGLYFTAGVVVSVPLILYIYKYFDLFLSRAREDETSDAHKGGDVAAQPNAKRRLAFILTAVPFACGAAAVCCSLVTEGYHALVFMFLFIALLIVGSAIDALTEEIPDEVWIAVSALGVLAVLYELIIPGSPDKIGLVARLIGAIAVSLPMLGLALVIDSGFGGGDIKLCAACGLFLGWRGVLIGFFLAVLAGGAWGGVLLLTRCKGKRDTFAFGPFLGLGFAAAACASGPIGNLIASLFDISRFII